LYLISLITQFDSIFHLLYK